MGYFPPTAIRFVTGDLVPEIVSAQKSLYEASGACDAAMLWLALAKLSGEPRREATIFPLLSQIQESIASNTLRYLAWEARIEGATETWKFMPSSGNPSCIRIECDLLRSNVSKEAAVLRLHKLVDTGAADVVMAQDGYYGYRPLIYLISVTSDGKHQMAQGVDPFAKISTAYGSLQAMRAGKPEFVRSGRIWAWNIEFGREVDLSSR